MYKLNSPDRTNEELEDDDEQRLEYPSFKMLDSLVQTRRMWTHDGQHFFLLMDTGGGDQEVAACVKLDVIGISYLPQKVVEKNTIHIRWVCTRNDWRQCGMLSVVMKFLIDAAEEYGVFLHLHSRPFDLELPQLSNQDQAIEWLENSYGSHNPSLKKDKANAKLLKKKYIEMGFCRFDGVGLSFGNRYWKRMCLGYRSSKIDDLLLNRYLDCHLNCN